MPGHLPGPVDVTTTAPKQQFGAFPNFACFAGCRIQTGHDAPCWLPLYPSPRLDGPAKVTSEYPYERYLGNQGDRVQVVCQVINPEPSLADGTSVQDDRLVSSGIWDVIEVPSPTPGQRGLTTTDGLKLAPDGQGYLVYGADLWLGNTGDHHLPCPA